MGEVYKQKISLKIVISAFFLSCIVMILTTPLHEATHWIMSDIDPYVEPMELHLFDDKTSKKNILSSYLGYVVIKEKYPGAFNDRPIWMDLLQEIVCITIQILITLMIVVKTFKLLIEKNLVKTL